MAGFFKNLLSFIVRGYHYFLSWFGSVIYRRPSRKIFVLGVTGTKGKSSTLEIINAILESAGKKTALLSSLRLKVGDLSERNPTHNTMPGRFFIQQFLKKAADAGCEYALLEVTSQGVAQYRHRFIDFNAAIFLNLHPEHIESHGSFEKYRAAKVKFFSDVGRFSKKQEKIFLINQEDFNSGYFSDAAAEKGKIYYFGRHQFAESLRGKKKNFILNNWLKNDFNLENASAATRFVESQGIEELIIGKTLKTFSGLAGRLEVVKEKPFRVVIDYAHTPASLEGIYKILLSGESKKQNQGQNKIEFGGKRLASNLICVLGSAGGGRDKWKRPVFGSIAARYCREIILTNEDPYDENPDMILDEIENGVLKFSNLDSESAKQSKKASYKILDRKQAIRKAISLAKPGDTVIITGKGSERWMHIKNNQKIPWSDKEATLFVLKK